MQQLLGRCAPNLKTAVGRAAAAAVVVAVAEDRSHYRHYFRYLLLAVDNGAGAQEDNFDYCGETAHDLALPTMTANFEVVDLGKRGKTQKGIE